MEEGRLTRFKNLIPKVNLKTFKNSRGMHAVVAAASPPRMHNTYSWPCKLHELFSSVARCYNIFNHSFRPPDFTPIPTLLMLWLYLLSPYCCFQFYEHRRHPRVQNDLCSRGPAKSMAMNTQSTPQDVRQLSLEYSGLHSSKLCFK